VRTFSAAEKLSIMLAGNKTASLQGRLNGRAAGAKKVLPQVFLEHVGISASCFDKLLITITF
jgi:hypothetical protein